MPVVIVFMIVTMVMAMIMAVIVIAAILIFTQRVFTGTVFSMFVIIRMFELCRQMLGLR